MKVSVVVPTYNRKDVLVHCIASILAQDTRDFEVIVVDDGSTDESLIYLESRYSNDERLRVCKLETNRGVNFARNRGVEFASGEYILFLDSDDVMVPGSMAKIFSAISMYDAGHFLFLVSDRENDASLPLDVTHFIYEDWVKGKVAGDFIHVVKRAILIDNPFFERFRAFESLNWFRIARSENKQVFTPITVSIRDRGRKDSLTRGYVLIDRNKIEQQYMARDLMLEMYGADFQTFNPALYNRMLIKNIFLGMALDRFHENRKYLLRLKRLGWFKLYSITLINSARLGALVRFGLTMKKIVKIKIVR